MNPLIIIGNRQTGKTTQLVNAVKNDDKGLLVVWNTDMKSLIYKRFNLEKNKIITHGELKNKETLKKLKPSNLYVDDAECLIHDYHSKHTLKGVAITLEDPRVRETKQYKQNY